MGTFFVLAVLIAIVALVIRGMIRDKKAGRSLQCGGDCKFCGGYCHQMGAAGPSRSGNRKVSEPADVGTAKAEAPEPAGGIRHV